MKRKERIARRLEGIENDAQPVLLQNCPGLVTHRLLEEDTPRYMRATDPYSPHFGRSNEEETSDSSVENQSRSRYQAESAGGKTRPPSYSPLVMDSQGLESKAERIARYKAERRRQLAEKYGLSIDSDVDSEYSSKYTRTRREQDVAEKRVLKNEKKEDERKDFSSVYSSKLESKEMRIAASDSKEYSVQERESSPEREKLCLNEDNEKKSSEVSSNRYDIPSASENSTSFSFWGHDSSLSEVPSSPKQTHRASLSSPKQLVATQSSHSLSDLRLGSTFSPEMLPPDDEEKLDERAKLSVAAKRLLFREMERSFDGKSIPKPRSRNTAVERRLRRMQDRSHTQPITTEEVVIAATLQASAHQKTSAKEEIKEAKDALEQDQPGEPDSSTLTLAEKMALFNKLSQPITKVVCTRSRGDIKQRRLKARYQTQPVTLGEVEQVQSDSGKIAPLSPTIVTSVSTMVSALSPVYSKDLHVKAAEDEAVSEISIPDFRCHSLVDNVNISLQNIPKTELWQPTVEVRESKRQSRECEEAEPKGFVKREENGIKKHSSFKEEPPHPVSDKTEDYNKEVKYAFPRKSSMELFSPQPLSEPAEQKESVSNVLQDKWEVKGQFFEDVMECEGIVTSLTQQREHDAAISEVVGTAATKSCSQSTAVVSCGQQETSELLEEKLNSRESKAEITEDALDASGKTMSIKERNSDRMSAKATDKDW